MQIRKYVPRKLTLAAGRATLNIKRNKPHILFVVGLGGVASGTVLACRATLKLSDTLDDIRAEIDEVKADGAGSPTQPADLSYVYGKSIATVGVLYAPAIFVGGLGVAALTGSHISLSKRNAALASAYAYVAKAYDDYRNRVRDEVGPERELEFYHAVMGQPREIDGKEMRVEAADPNQWSPYARFFDEASHHWVKDSELNKLYVQSTQNYFNSLLQTRGYVFLNEVYERLGIDQSRPGQVVGWYFGGTGDNYVDFGMFRAYNANFVNGWERNILLDFNVDGIILDKI